MFFKGAADAAHALQLVHRWKSAGKGGEAIEQLNRFVHVYVSAEHRTEVAALLLTPPASSTSTLDCFISFFWWCVRFNLRKMELWSDAESAIWETGERVTIHNYTAQPIQTMVAADDDATSSRHPTAVRSATVSAVDDSGEGVTVCYADTGESEHIRFAFKGAAIVKSGSSHAAAAGTDQGTAQPPSPAHGQRAGTSGEVDQDGVATSGAKKNIATTVGFLPENLTVTRYLDVGSNDGDFTRWMVDALKLGEDAAFAVDPHPKNNGGGGITFVKADASSLPFPDNHFSVVSCMNVLHHMQDLSKGLEEIARVLQPGGCLLVREHECMTEEYAAYLDIMHYLFVLMGASTTIKKGDLSTDALLPTACQQAEAARIETLFAPASLREPGMKSGSYGDHAGWAEVLGHAGFELHRRAENEDQVFRCYHSSWLLSAD